MRRTLAATILTLLLVSNLAFAAPTVFLKDGGKETGTSVWTRGDKVYLSKQKVVYEYAADEVLLEQTQKFNKIDGFATPATTLGGKCCASACATAPGDLVEQLMKASNVDRQIDQFIQQFSSGALSAAGQNPELNDIFVQALKGFDGQKAKRKIRAYYRSHLDKATLESMLAWTRTPLGMKIRDAEAAMNVASMDDAQQMLSDFESNPPPAGRLALIRELDRAGNVTEMALQMVTEAAAGVISAIPGSPAERKQARKEIDAVMKQQKETLEPQLRSQVEAGLTVTYKGLSDSELREYIAFTSTEPARKFNKATMGALSEMIRDMSASMIRNIVKAVEKKKEAMQR